MDENKWMMMKSKRGYYLVLNPTLPFKEVRRVEDRDEALALRNKLNKAINLKKELVVLQKDGE